MAQATMAAANAIATGTFASHLSRPHAAGDSRLLSNLIKSERNYISNLHATVTSAHAASSALSVWGTSEAPDVADTSSRVANLLSACTDVQSTHVAAIEGYRAALKDVADREASIRNVVRDRDILVSRLIKASNKSANVSSKKSPEERAEKVAIAQRELQACEEVLTSEEAALVGVKRRTFKEALTMRMKTMGDAGAAMVDAAQEAILLLDEFDSTAQMPHSPMYDDQVAAGANGQEWYAYQQHPQYVEETNEERMVAMNPNFENSSVTPSQSASQIYQPQFQRNSAAYSAPFRGIGEAEGEGQRYKGPQEDSDSDDEDWRRSFGQGQNTTMHEGGGVPAPHQLSANVGTHRSFIPMDKEITPAPTPPTKDSSNRLSTASRGQSMKKKSKQPSVSRSEREFGPPTTIPMPPVPTAPRLVTDGPDLGPIPSAPRLYMPGASGDQGDSSSEEDNRNTTVNRGGWASRPQNDGASSDGEATARQPSRPDAPKRGNSFFGKVGKLFKTDMKGEAVSGKGENRSSRRRKDSVGSSSNWGGSKAMENYLNESRKQASKDPASMSRRQSVLRAPLARDGHNSSDEEPIDERNLVRVTNPKRPQWQSEKPSSDVGTRKTLKDELKRPGSLKRSPSASVTAGPKSWKAIQEEEMKKRRAYDTPVAPMTLPSTEIASGTPSIKKKKKKSKQAPSADGGSEIGTQSTRTRASDIPAPMPTLQHRHSIVVPGDASAGVRRSESLTYGSIKSDTNGKLARRSSKRMSAMSNQNVHGNTFPKQGGMAASDGQGKFSTNSWVAKSNVSGDENNPMPKSAPALAPIAAHTSVTTTPSKLKQSVTAAALAPKHVPQPSASMSPPLKPALKVPGSSDLARSGSVTSSAAGGSIPLLPPPITAPPPVTSMKNLNEISAYNTTLPAFQVTDDSNKAPTSVLSIEEDKRFDGSGRLDVNDYGSPIKIPKSSNKPAAVSLPRIDMPPSEPFKVDLDDKRAEGFNPVRENSANDLMTPGEQSAYRRFMSQDSNESPERAHNNQPSGVTRFTDRIASVGRGVLGFASTPSQPADDTLSPKVPVTASPGKLSRTYSDQNVRLSSESSEEGGRGGGGGGGGGEAAKSTALTSAVVPSIANLLPTNNAATNNVATSQASETSIDGGSGLGRRKSVRMAPDVKLPPETPTDDIHRKVSSYDFTAPGSNLSSRIAPPPQAPPRLNMQAEKPIDLGYHPREVTGWSIRSTPMDDSSDEDDRDNYKQARESFSDISKSWGKTSKTRKPKVASSDGGGSAVGKGTGSIKKKKKKAAASTNSGYNPAIPLPAGMEVVGRSGSLRR